MITLFPIGALAFGFVSAEPSAESAAPAQRRGFSTASVGAFAALPMRRASCTKRHTRNAGRPRVAVTRGVGLGLRKEALPVSLAQGVAGGACLLASHDAQSPVLRALKMAPSASSATASPGESFESALAARTLTLQPPGSSSGWPMMDLSHATCASTRV